MSKINIDNELCNYIDANDGQVTLGGLAEHFAEYGYQYAQDHPAWVSVEDELPKETGWYLVATPTLNSKIDVALWDGKWRRLVTITHWMPLPQLPVKKGGEQ